MRTYFKLFTLLPALALTLLLPACELNDAGEPAAIDEGPAVELAFSGDAITEGTPVRSIIGGVQYTTNGAVNVPLEADITVAFDRDINPSTLNTSTFKVVRTDTGEAIEGRISYANRIATFKPVFRFVYVTNDVTSTGLKQDLDYQIVLNASAIKDTTGIAQGYGNRYYSFRTTDLDYGIYFMGSDGEFAKAVPGKANAFYDPSRPTVFYVHGWQPGTSENDFGREMPFYYNSKYVKNVNSAAIWRSKGWNVACFFWAQWADEGEVKDAQAKLYRAYNDRKGMRYHLRGKDQYREYTQNLTVTDLALECYRSVFANYTGSNIRIIGHSLGNQLATTLTYAISNEYQAGYLPSRLVPKRLVLLDPFWGKGEENCVNKRWVGEVCRTYVKALIERHNMAVEQYKSSALGGAVADENLDMRKMNAFFRIWPDFIGIIDQADQHKYAYAWYAMSMSAVVTGDNNARFGAAASETDIRTLMNFGKWSQYFWYTSSGKKTAATTDDYFKRQGGVNTW